MKADLIATLKNLTTTAVFLFVLGITFFGPVDLTFWSGLGTFAILSVCSAIAVRIPVVGEALLAVLWAYVWVGAASNGIVIAAWILAAMSVGAEMLTIFLVGRFETGEAN